MPTPDSIRELVHNPRESLTSEIKAWIDPTTPDGQAKIVKCVLAMRNHNGGFMVIGLDDETYAPTETNQPADVRTAFHIDRIQGLIGRFASQIFEVTVHFVDRDGHLIPVIEIPSGVRTPVAARSSLSAPGGPIIRENRVYVRSLDANNTPKYTEALWSDWSRVVEVCFDNREADIGRFLRRHLPGLSPGSLREFASALQDQQPQPSLEERLRAIMDAGVIGFRNATSSRQLDVPPHGSWEVAVLVEGDFTRPRADLAFLRRLLASNPNLTGWPAWLDSQGFGDLQSRPHLRDNIWEAVIVSLNSDPFSHIDYWTIDPNGEFYLYRALDDDIARQRSKIPPLTVLDFGLPLIRTAEALVVGLAYAKVMGASADGPPVSFAFRWSGLKNRQLSSWAQPTRYMSPGRIAYRDIVTSLVTVPLETPLSSLPQFVEAATEPLFEAFDEFKLSTDIVEDFVRRVVERRP